MGENETREAVNPPENIMVLGGEMSAGLLEVGNVEDPVSVPALLVDLKLGILFDNNAAFNFAEALGKLCGEEGQGFRVIKDNRKPLASVPKEVH